MWIALLLILGLGLALLGALGADWFERKIFNLGGLYRHLPRLPEALRQRLQGGDFHPNEIAGMISLFLPLSLAMAGGAWRRSSDPAWPQRALPAQRLLPDSHRSHSRQRPAADAVTQCDSWPPADGPAWWPWSGNGAWRSFCLCQAPASTGCCVTAASGSWLNLAQIRPTRWAGWISGSGRCWRWPISPHRHWPGNLSPPAIAYAPFFDGDPVLADVGHAHNIFCRRPWTWAFRAWWPMWRCVLLVAVHGLESLYKRTTSPTGRLLSAGLLTSLLAFHIFSLTDAVAPGAKPVFTLWMFVGMIVALGQANVIGNLPQRDLKT
ncbi:MAG: hypothetical protein IPH87_16475 [Anaerolineae bacterium]|nr:hypothetical protein [Anaerolineae bacterium]